MSVVLLPGIGEEQVPLTQLISLEDAGFEEWYECYRELNDEHVAHLVESEPGTWPRLDTVKVRIDGKVFHAIIDGNHRKEAAIQRKDPALRVHSASYANEDTVIDAAFQANLNHGFAASTATRSDYAVWLYFHDESEKPNLSAIARKVGLNQSTVSRAVKKATQNEVAEDEQEGQEETYKAEVTNAARLVTALHKFFAQERTLRGMLSDGTKQVDVTHRAKMLYRHIASIPKDKQQEAFRELVSLNTSLQSFIEMCTPPKKTGTG